MLNRITVTIAALAMATSTLAHMEMTSPPPLKSSKHPKANYQNIGESPCPAGLIPASQREHVLTRGSDYSMTQPLGDYPCKVSLPSLLELGPSCDPFDVDHRQLANVPRPIDMIDTHTPLPRSAIVPRTLSNIPAGLHQRSRREHGLGGHMVSRFIGNILDRRHCHSSRRFVPIGNVVRHGKDLERHSELYGWLYGG
jgi:hypothetical protein